MFAENWEFSSTAQTTLATPLWIPQIFWISGLGFFLVCLAFVSTRCLASLIRGDWQTIHDVAGVKSVAEEIDEETRGFVRQYSADMSYLKDELRKATDA